ncbi:4Fe-4S single cluster domain-containing protein [Anaerovirgula multivorans]|uniref:4Fe-4S single cluster domain-containing protein n=1 Tax=Anaerovirgula multivorans TaxID=312168 RepID=A0A239GGZ6_9FIRM|nr:4Fe-4S cluster-binding domain-containing protein [Anaerovirgula multivorans]SNS68586.1 4Fe-4S single cluster domain-containing protein [Anaerovirgula multivorans]
MLRREHFGFGGILFNIDTGDVVEMDREAFTVISIIKDIEAVEMKALLELPIAYKGKKIDGQTIKGVLSKLKAMGVVNVMPKGVLSDNYRKKLMEKSLINFKWPTHQHLSASETVHWAVTFKCSESCPDCYIERHKKVFTNELDTQEAQKLINKIANNGVFQLAIGGGEAFMRNDLEVIAYSAAGLIH